MADKDNNQNAMTKLEQVFKMFVAKYERRDCLNNPFEIGEMLYATDANKLVRIPRKYCDFSFENLAEEFVKADKVIPAPNCSFYLNLDETVLKPVLTEKETIKHGQDETCAECYGEGWVEWGYVAEQKEYYSEADCPVCKGSGLSYEAPIVETGKMTSDEYRVVRIYETETKTSRFFYARLIIDLLKVKNLLSEEIEIININENPTKPLFCKIGICEVLIMPMMVQGQKDEEGNDYFTINVTAL